MARKSKKKISKRKEYLRLKKRRAAERKRGKRIEIQFRKSLRDMIHKLIDKAKKNNKFDEFRKMGLPTLARVIESKLNLESGALANKVEDIKAILKNYKREHSKEFEKSVQPKEDEASKTGN